MVFQESFEGDSRKIDKNFKGVLKVLKRGSKVCLKKVSRNFKGGLSFSRKFK